GIVGEIRLKLILLMNHDRKYIRNQKLVLVFYIFCSNGNIIVYLPFSWGETRARGDYSVPLVWLSNDWIDTKKENE
ncbi:hypothetical protein, partial [Mediterraneibacter gnavus]|uniref:hypothetical protein n=1 Tax=Mediterraneibacter gnavus TaxID=33038 RepID=UPI001A9B3F21